MSEKEREGLSGLRAELDGVDDEIVRLIARRLELVGLIGREKAQGADGIRDPERERQVLSHVEAAARELGLSAPLARKIFSEIISHSLTRQAAFLAGTAPGEPREVRVAYQGVAHAYSHLAAQKYLAGLGLAGRLSGFRSFAEVVAALTSSAADLAILPIENTTAGSINQVYDLLRHEEVHIVGEEIWRVDHCLAAPRDVPLASIQRVLSHPQGIEQCSLFLAAMPQARAETYFDTAEALKTVAEQGDPAQAAIGPPEAADAYGLVILRRGIANQEENYTRFFVLAREPRRIDLRVPCKTSLILTTRHEKGALMRCLETLAAQGLSMTKLESRPRPGRPWEYMFFIDLEGNLAEERMEAALEELRVRALYLKVLGCYPAKATASEARPADVPAPAEAAAAVPHAAITPTERADAPPGAPPGATPPTASSPAIVRSKHYRLADRAARPEDTVVRVGDLLIGANGFTVMAGPCSVESEAQIRETALQVRRRGAHVLRGGVFKPRTSPYAFQGLGLDGLALLQAAGKAAGMPIVTEVMAIEQVRAVAEKADILQVGTRNMQNFNLLREVGKVDRPVLLKRGLSSTIEEWLAAAEYILNQGNGQVILCERGIRTFENATRNTLDLSAVAVLRERTHLPVVVDPSHGTGKRSYVAPMAWAARAAGAHGLLLEVHPDPDHALSDGDQSLTFAEFGRLMDGLATIAPPRG
jgi:chorismate mutase/prephenate dehydratase